MNPTTKRLWITTLVIAVALVGCVLLVCVILLFTVEFRISPTS